MKGQPASRKRQGCRKKFAVKLDAVNSKPKKNKSNRSCGWKDESLLDRLSCMLDKKALTSVVRRTYERRVIVD